MAGKNFPDWEKLYRDQEVETMPWYKPDLDLNFERNLADLKIVSGLVLDIGSGPGTQALELAKRGFQVIGTDISATAVGKARDLAEKEKIGVEFIHDDILHTRLDKKFDLILDRGCFHVLPLYERDNYVKIVANLLKPGGYFFLKCFSVKETTDGGPHRFTPRGITGYFQNRFEIVAIQDAIFKGTPSHRPRALSCVMRKRS